MSISMRMFEVTAQVASLQSSAPSSVTAADYPVRCELTNAVNGLIAFLVGNLKGLASPLALVVILAFAVGLIVAGSRSNSGKFIKGIMYALAGLLLIVAAPAVVAAMGAASC